MNTSPTQDSPSGFLLIDKPVDWTSHDVVGYLRKITGIKKIGHAGTLDPFATGLLIVAISRAATKQIDSFKEMEKEYIATIQFGATSDTQDCTGVIVPTKGEPVTHTTLEKVLETFIGTQTQIPPMYSAKKVQGKKLYDLARKGITIERAPNEITIHTIELTAFDESTQQATIRVVSSPGTYIRTLCADIGEKVQTGAYCAALRRTKIGHYTVLDAIEPKQIDDTWKARLIC